MSETTEQVFREVAAAYGDCFGSRKGTRNLGFRASYSVTPTEAAKIMKICCPVYNNFAAYLLEKLPADCQVFLAREYSVCIYVRKGEEDIPSINCDEYDVLNQTTFGQEWYSGQKRHEFPTDHGGHEGEIRLWWD